MMTAVMTHVVLALGVAAVAALVVVILIAIVTSRGRQPARTVRTPGVARTSGTRKSPPPETAGLHLLDLD
ncbi:hypothetical protein [Pseudoclavibacter sp. VKM Ac-2888]|uniref:hypothetical protein n=1 Tax=Pseudoclavibacter sp. VKM Ac-2888 TaxID=2783830 RepID=UPI00188B3AC4|nr:hypothetical protein [Pseudoclavibacter sp. VKM Ac-2888]MBF4549426.1 hypothetical protein [Pseudoclavibacter sp. VKM Ac-2888]